MSITLEELARIIDPERTALLLGAGASIPSGAPSGAQLAGHLWAKVAKSEAQSDDLAETASILSRKYGRKEVVAAVISKLQPLKPTGGMLTLPQFDWKGVFTTNYDLIVEQAYQQSSKDLVAIRSNFDFSSKESEKGLRYYKIHGCVTHDSSIGSKASMILSEEDYEEFSKYRQTLFTALKTALLTGDVLVIGQSLRDRHLIDTVKEVLRAKAEGAPGQIYCLIYDKDDLRAPILEDRGARVAFGEIDRFFHLLATGVSNSAVCPAVSSASYLPLLLVSTVHDVAIVRTHSEAISRMFNGAPAWYPDIRAGGTFERAGHRGICEKLAVGEPSILAITGAAGVGKTTFARQIVSTVAGPADHAWEHRPDYPFASAPWVAVEAKLRSEKKIGVLLVDECTSYMRGINQLVEALSELDAPSLRLIVTANSAQWTPRMKSPKFFTKGMIIELSRMGDEEINSLVNLVEFNPEIANLVTAEFKRQGRAKQISNLRQKCEADMYVCLKNIFAKESLDDILLHEYNDLSEPLQEYYRYVAALQAVGARVHRQLIIRMLGMQPDAVSAALAGLRGIVEEYDIDDRNGIYGWSVRHLVIARKITEYKFSSFHDMVELFDNIIDNVNPGLMLELQTVRNICDTEYGIGRIADAPTRRRLYKKLSETVPGERIPWHRMIREAINDDDYPETDNLIREAEEAVGADAPIDRFKVRLMMLRAKKTPKLTDGDRTAILRRAYELALSNIKRHHWDKFSYAVLCDVALELVRRGDSEYLFVEALEKIRTAAGKIQDPEMWKQVRHYEGLQVHTR